VEWNLAPSEAERDDPFEDASLLRIWWPILLLMVGALVLVGLLVLLPISVFSRELGALDLWGETRAPCERPSHELWFAAGQGDVAELQRQLDGTAASPVMVDATLDGWTPLLCAADHGQTAAAAVLLEAGADPDLAIGGRPAPIAMAARLGNVALIDQLVHAGADPSSDLGGTTALIQAIEAGQLEAVEALLDAGADPEGADEHGHTPADAARAADDPDATALLSQSSVDLSG